MKHVDPNVKVWACAHALSLNIATDEAVKELKLISNQKIGLVSLSAEMTLKQWKQQGFLKF